MGEITAECRSRAGSLIVDLPDSFARRWQDPLNDTGTGKLNLQNDDTALASIPYSAVLRFLDGGQPRFASLVERKERVSKTQEEEVECVTTISGRGTLAVFEEGIVEPPLGADRTIFADTVHYNFALPAYDDSGWSAAVVNPNADYGEPDAWPDSTALWIADRVGSTFDPTNGPPLGDMYGRKSFTVAGRTVAELWGAADDAYEVWLDGQHQFDEAFDVGYLGQSRLQMVELDAGTHYLAVRFRNMFPNRSGLRMSLLKVDPQTGATTGTILAKTDTSWKCLGYPATAPGFTPGEVIRLLVEAAQDRGALTGVTLNFDDDDDSAGDPWPVTADISVQVGDDLLTVLRQLCESYVDLRMSPTSLELSAYATRGESTAVEYDIGALTGLHHEGSV